VNYRTAAGGVGNPHPLLQAGLLGPIEVFPDHPHEGECRIPTTLTTSFTLDGSSQDEWPVQTGGGPRVSPEIVALTMSHGDSFPSKEAIVPRSFISIAAYDGQLADVGRVTTDATWHHFVNINIDGTGSPRTGLQDPPGTDTPDLLRIRQYYRNLAAWLMPKNVRRCLRFPYVLTEVVRYPLFEELRLQDLHEATGQELHRIGEQVAAALAKSEPAWHAEAIIFDALEDGLDEVRAVQLRALGDRSGRMSARALGTAALGAITTATVAKLAKLKEREKPDAHKIFDAVAQEAAAIGVDRYIEACRKDLHEFDAILEAGLAKTA
jgi:hypothetical protein